MGYSIGQAAKMTGLTAHTLRYYEKEGLLPFLKKKQLRVAGIFRQRPRLAGNDRMPQRHRHAAERNQAIHRLVYRGQFYPTATLGNV